LLIGIRFAVTRQDQAPAIGGGQMHIDHLHASKLLQHRPRGQSRGERTQALLERDLQAVGEEGDEDVRLDAILVLMMDGSDGKIAFELLERLLD
jgi:hypothetical protein